MKISSHLHYRLTTADGTAVAGYMTDSDGSGSDTAYTIVDSWFYGIDSTHESGFVMRIIAEDSAYWDEYIWGQGIGPVDDVEDDDYVVAWDWECAD